MDIENTLEGLNKIEQIEQIEGLVDTILFANETNGYAVFRVNLIKRRGRLTVTTGGGAPFVGQKVILTGSFVVHPRFGRQFRADNVEVEAPTDAGGIESFLSSGAIEGIGESMARRIVEKFGDETLKIMEENPRRLLEVQGLGKKTLEKIMLSWNKNNELREIMLFLTSHQISGVYAGRIFKKYGSRSVEVMRETPYNLARDIEGIGFLTADRMAEKLGIPKEDEGRISAGLDYALFQLTQKGHTAVPDLSLIDAAESLLKIDRDSLWDILKKDIAKDRFHREDFGGESYIYPSYLYLAEKNTAEKLLRLKNNVPALNKDETEGMLDAWQKRHQLVLGDLQRAAVSQALTQGVFVLTGGPGTGKTTIIRCIRDLCIEQGLLVLLGAPTGRAAKRLSEATGAKAATVHRMLRAQSKGDGENSEFVMGTDEELNADVIILDEVSMMDIVLMRYFLDAVPLNCRVILVGDKDQLPSVGPGTVLSDILDSGAIPCLRLTEIYRQKETSSIVWNAHSVLRGRMPSTKPVGDFSFREFDKDEAVTEEILRLVTEILPEQGFDPLRDIQILSPMHRMECGVENLNIKLQERMNPPSPEKAELKKGTQVFRQGDKVMQIKNNYQKDVFNGDIGFITLIKEKSLFVSFDSEIVEYEANETGELILAYAMSVHKSQGSEYPVVILPLVPGHHIMLQRNLLYTAITRAKDLCILLGQKKALSTAVMSNQTKRRWTLLRQRLSGEL